MKKAKQKTGEKIWEYHTYVLTESTVSWIFNLNIKYTHTCVLGYKYIVSFSKYILGYDVKWICQKRFVKQPLKVVRGGGKYKAI